ncbi:MAG: response regulator transcription factor [Ktedonobacterales bacterium]
MESVDAAAHNLSIAHDRDAAVATMPHQAVGTRTRIFVIDDHSVFRDGLQALFLHEEAFEVVGQAENGAQALALVRYYQPDIVLLDIGLRNMNGLDLVNQLRRVCPNVRIIVLTGHHEREYIMTALRLGVHGFLHKDMSAAALFAALRTVLQGERVVAQPEVLTTVLTEFGELMRVRERERSGLAEQEIEILRLAATGLNNKDIGARQFLSEITVKRKMQDIYRKLEVKSRAQAVAEAIRLGLI